jgi:hypothetical protein
VEIKSVKDALMPDGMRETDVGEEQREKAFRKLSIIINNILLLSILIYNDQ